MKEKVVPTFLNLSPTKIGCHLESTYSIIKAIRAGATLPKAIFLEPQRDLTPVHFRSRNFFVGYPYFCWVGNSAELSTC